MLKCSCETIYFVESRFEVLPQEHGENIRLGVRADSTKPDGFSTKTICREAFKKISHAQAAHLDRFKLRSFDEKARGGKMDLRPLISHRYGWLDRVARNLHFLVEYQAYSRRPDFL